MWFGTWDGLYRYDGSKLRRFAQRPFDSASLAYNSVKGLAAGPSGSVYVATDGAGLDVYDAYTETFRRTCRSAGGTRPPPNRTLLAVGRLGAEAILFDESPGHVSRLDTRTGAIASLAPATRVSQRRATAYASAPDGRVWVGHEDGRVFAYAPTAPTPRLVYAAESSSAFGIRGLYHDPDNRLWIADTDGLHCLDVTTGSLLAVPAPLDRTHCSALSPGSGGELWVGTTDGLYRLSPDGTQVSAYRHNDRDATSLLSGEVLSLYRDRQQVLWVGTVTGVSRLPLTGPRFGGVTNAGGRPAIGDEAGVWALAKTPDGDIWTARPPLVARYAADGGLKRILRPGDLGFESAAPLQSIHLRGELSADGGLFVEVLNTGSRAVEINLVDPATLRIIRRATVSATVARSHLTPGIPPLHEVTGGGALALPLPDQMPDALRQVARLPRDVLPAGTHRLGHRITSVQQRRARSLRRALHRLVQWWPAALR